MALLGGPAHSWATGGTLGADPVDLDFGSQKFGTISSNQPVTLIVTDSATNTIASVTITQSDTDYAILNDLCTGHIISTVVSCTFDVSFTPGALGTRTGTVVVDGNADDISVPLTGIGLAYVSITPATFDAGAVLVGEESEPQAISVTATAIVEDVEWDILGVSITDGGAEFSIDSEDCTDAPLVEDGSCEIQVVFAPSTASTRSGKILIESSNLADVSIALTGIGNTAPALPDLVFPGDGDTDIATSLTFTWKISEDPEGDDVTYTFFICEKEDFTGCDGTEVTALTRSAGSIAAGLATGAGGLLLAGFWIPAFRTRRFPLAALLVVSILSVALVVACSSSGGGGKKTTADKGDSGSEPGDGEAGYEVTGLDSNTKYFWKVSATDSNGASVESEVYSFTTK
jgi:hypothetical protein